MPSIVIKQTANEDQLEIFANGTLVGSYNHDDDGWSGMEKAEELAAQIGYALGVEVVRE